MMIKIFTTDKNGNIVMSGKELKALLDEAYWEGYRNNNSTWVYKTPSWTPFHYTTTAGNATTISLNSEAKSNVTADSDKYTINNSARTTDSVKVTL